MITKNKTRGILIGLACLLSHQAYSTSTPEIIGITPTNHLIQLVWTNGFSPYQAQSRTSLLDGVWIDFGDPTFARSITQGDGSESTGFFRILGSAAATDSAQYRLTFNSTWSAATHPTDFPSPNEHYSPLVGGTHDSGVTFWEPGGLATVGLKNVAETGGTGNMASEVNAAISAGDAEFLLNGGGLGSSPGATEMTFTITQSHPLVTMVTMIAPSPDWFVGIHGVNLFVDGDWVDERSIPLLPYDAGTDDGATYASPNAASDPPQTIQPITGYPLENEGSVAPFGSFTFSRIN